MTEENKIENSQKLEKYLSPLSVWALSFGCAVGWGAFVMPGTTFLPLAGPLGTVIGMLLGGIVMFIIGINYHYLMNKFPDAGGTLTYTIRTFGYDHGYMSSCFLILVYVAIAWANATAIALICRNLLGNTFCFGYMYSVLGYDVYAGEVILTIIVIMACGALCVWGKRLSAIVQTLFALVLIVGILIVLYNALISKEADFSLSFADGFSNIGDVKNNHFLQVIAIMALSPWAFVGFESVSNSTAGFKFDVKKTKWIFLGAIVAGIIAYCGLSAIAVMHIPAGFSSWSEYIKNIGSLKGLEGLPTFYVAREVMGNAGVMVLGLSALAGILTGLIGNFIAASRLLYSMSEDGIIPKWFGKLNEDNTPRNALIFLTLISLAIPFLGRTAIGWIIDVNTIGASIAYLYTSACSYKWAKAEKNILVLITSIIGMAFSAFFFVYFMSWLDGAMAAESYMLLALWAIIGFVYYRNMIIRNAKINDNFGKSTVAWLLLLFLIFYTTLMWIKQSTDDMTRQVAHNIGDYYDHTIVYYTPEVRNAVEGYLNQQLVWSDKIITRNSFIQMLIIVSALAIMFSIYRVMQEKQKKHELEKLKAQAESKSKSVFLSNMSHDIRTPMNAIIGYINLAEDKSLTNEELRDYLDKIKASSNHLLALINDVLEMSRIESGKLEVEPVEMNIGKTLDEMRNLFITQMGEKNVTYVVDHSKIKNGNVYCDKNRLNRVLLNLISNSYKFTPEGGTVSVVAIEKGIQDNMGTFEISVTDTGIGMSEEFAAKVFEAFEREKNSTVKNIQGTGLGMSICKSLVELMGGTIEVKSKQGSGTTFIVTLKLKLQDKQDNTEASANEGTLPVEKQALKENTIDYAKVRILLVDDVQINREIASRLLKKKGFMVELATNGREAIDAVINHEADYFDLILMDVQMPEIDGYEATGYIRHMEDAKKAGIPIIAMTANAFTEDMQAAKKHGMNAHVAKPIDVKALLNTIEDVLQNKTEIE